MNGSEIIPTHSFFALAEQRSPDCSAQNIGKTRKITENRNVLWCGFVQVHTLVCIRGCHDFAVILERPQSARAFASTKLPTQIKCSKFWIAAWIECISKLEFDWFTTCQSFNRKWNGQLQSPVLLNFDWTGTLEWYELLEFLLASLDEKVHFEWQIFPNARVL